jgi:glycyl-tRNA synthetase (class II)
MDIEFVELEYR